MKQEGTLFDRIISRIKNNPVIASVLVAGVVIIALATFTGAVKSLISLISENQPVAAQAALRQLSLEYTPVIFVESAKKGDTHAVKLFLTAEMNPNAKDKKGNTALMYAVSENHIQIIDALLKAKANVNEKNRGGKTALLWANNENTLHILLDNGADANAINQSFIFASALGRTKFLSILLDKGAEVKKIGSDALLAAANSQYADAPEKELNDTIMFLLDLGVDVNIKDKDGWTGLLWAAFSGKTSMAQILLNRGADVNAKCECRVHNGGGYTALMIGVNNDNGDLVSILLSKGADINEKNHYGETALILAAARANNSSTDIVRALLAAGARVDEKDNKGRTAIYFAKLREHSEIIELLEHANAAVP